MKQLSGVQDGLCLTAKHMEWATQTLIEALKDRIKDMMVKPGILSIGFYPEDEDVGGPYPLSSYFEVSQGTNAGTIKVQPGIAYDADAELIQIDHAVSNIPVPADGKEYYVVVRHKDVSSNQILNWWPGYPKPGTDRSWKKLDGWEIDLVDVSSPLDPLDIPLAKIRRDPTSPESESPVEIEDLRKDHLLTLRFFDLPQHTHDKTPIEDNFYDFPHDHEWDQVWEDKESYIPKTLIAGYTGDSGYKEYKFFFFGRCNRLGGLVIGIESEGTTIDELRITAPKWNNSPSVRETVFNRANIDFSEAPIGDPAVVFLDVSQYRPGIWEFYMKSSGSGRIWVVLLEPTEGAGIEEDPPSPYTDTDQQHPAEV